MPRAIRLEAEKRFEATSPVARYWLTQCQGFRVGGAGSGRVEEIVSRSDHHTPDVLVVRHVFRRREIPVSAVHAVVPAERLIVLGDGVAAGERRMRRRPASAVTRAVRRAASRTASSSRRVVVEHGRPGLHRLAVVSRRAAAAIWLALVALGRASRSSARAVIRGSAVAAAAGVAALRACGRSARSLGLAIRDHARPLRAQASAAVRESALAAASYAEALRAYRTAATGRVAALSRRRRTPGG